MKYKRAIFIYNPKAGKGLIHQNLASIVEEADENDYVLTVVPTRAQTDMEELISSFDLSVFDKLVCCGGDGTLNQVISYLVKNNISLPVGYIPAGSTNDFAISLGIPFDMRLAAAVAVSNNTSRIDIAKFNTKYFVYVAAFGMFTNIAYSTDQNLKNIIGHLAYVLKGATEIANIRSYHMQIEYDDMVIEGNYLLGMICSTTSVGGVLNLEPLDVSFDDGCYEVILIKDIFNSSYDSDSTDLLIGSDIIERNIVSFKASRLNIHSYDKAPWTLDGEYGGDPEDISISILNKKIEISVPK